MKTFRIEIAKLRLINQAIDRHPGDQITPCSNSRGSKTWDECFTNDMGILVFWYNIGSDTRMEIERR